MAFNLRGSSPIADGSITESKLANNAVTAAKIAANAVEESKISSNAVTEAKIADTAISTNKLANNAVSVAKVTQDIVTQHFFGSEIELSNTGISETGVGEFNFLTSANNNENWKRLGYAVKIKTNDVAHTATAKLYIDSVQYGSDINSTSLTYENKLGADIDISGLSAGNHLFEIKILSSNAAGITSIGQIDIYLGK